MQVAGESAARVADVLAQRHDLPRAYLDVFDVRVARETISVLNANHCMPAAHVAPDRVHSPGPNGSFALAQRRGGDVA